MSFTIRFLCFSYFTTVPDDVFAFPYRISKEGESFFAYFLRVAFVH